MLILGNCIFLYAFSYLGLEVMDELILHLQAQDKPFLVVKLISARSLYLKCDRLYATKKSDRFNNAIALLIKLQSV